MSFIVRTWLLVLLCFPCGHLSAQPATDNAQSFSVMAWNIWHGGKEDGKEIGPQRVVDVIRDSKADLVAMQETYGSGELIAKELEFSFHPRGTNVSIHSRFPVVEDISVFEEFKCVGALVELPDKRQVAFYSIWLPYNKEIWEEGTRKLESKDMLAACQASCDDLIKIDKAITARLSDKKYQNVPVVIAGDFNSMSHLDYISSAEDQFGISIDWPTSQVLSDHGFRDSYRELHPEVNRQNDRTWTPRFKNQEQDRIDYIYYKGSGVLPIESNVIDTHAEKFPSDHAALVTRFAWLKSEGRKSENTENKNGKESTNSQPGTGMPATVRVASYNIRHGAGTDGRLDLERTAAFIENLRPDIIGLQEVDNQAKRSGAVDQPEFLGQRLGMSSAFGSFMKYQGGNYGMAILSRYPIVKEHEIRLPEGNEPRVALACEIVLPSGQHVMAVNVHFDWVNDDKFRYAQATKVAEFLNKLEMPYLLLGDFNDTRNSRTLELLSENKLEATKPVNNRFTFSSTKPTTEIDFVFAYPKSSWGLHHTYVFDGPKTSDHRPVLAILELMKSGR